MKALVGAFNQEKALVGAFSVITNLRMYLFHALRRFQWSSARQQSAARAMETYTVGRPLWVRYSGLDTLGFLELPVPFTSELCQTSSPVQFMRDRQSSCLVDMETADCEQDDILNANSYFQPFSVVASPKLFAQRDGGVGNSSQQGVFLPVTAHACRGDVCEAVTSFPAPTSSCENLVQRVQYVVHHEVVLQKVPSEANPKVRNHGEGPY